MKAKEYAKVFLESPLETQEEINAAVGKAAMDFSKEVIDICKSRNSESASCVIGAFKQQCQKWQAFAKIVNKKLDGELIKLDGFKDFTEFNFPQIKGHL